MAYPNLMFQERMYMNCVLETNFSTNSLIWRDIIFYNFNCSHMFQFVLIILSFQRRCYSELWD